MEATTSALHEIAVPASIFATLKTELAKEAGALPTIHALHHAGYEAGVATAGAIANGSTVREMTQAAFFDRLTRFFVRRGWGTLATDGRGKVGMLCSADWAESDPSSHDADATCSYSTGFFSGLMSTLAGGPVAVLEVSCRSRGDGECRFVFGSEQTIHDLYGHLLEGLDLEEALSTV